MEEFEAAGQLLADAIGKLMLLIMMAVVARLAATQATGATSKTAGTVEELYAALRQSRLRAGFAEWVKANEQRLLANPRLRMHNVVGGTGGKSSETLTPSQLKQLRETPPAAAPVPQSRSGGSGNPANGSEVTSNEVTSTRLSQPGGLMATENKQIVRFDGILSKPTHTLLKHGPGVTDEYLQNRVLNELAFINTEIIIK